jgi:hypothetical protein
MLLLYKKSYIIILNNILLNSNDILFGIIINREPNITTLGIS